MFGAARYRRYLMDRCYSWNESQRQCNLRLHQLDFEDAPRVFEGSTFTFEDARADAAEQRFVTLGFLDTVPVSVVHTESPTEICIVSLRRATRHEAAILCESLQD
jgi:uncharacterized protein